MTQSIERQPNLLLNGVFPVLLIFLFYIYSGVGESVPFFARMRPQLILAVLGLLAVFGTGQFIKVLSTPIGKCIALFTAWFIACIPFAAWPGGSFGVLTDFWYKAALTYLLTAGLLTTLPQANRVYHTIAYAVGILSVLALLKNERLGDGRLALLGTRYHNSNDLAWSLLVGLTFIGFLYLRGTRVQKVIAVLAVPPILVALSRTGSRGGAMGVGTLVVVMLAQAKRATRIRLMVGVPILLLAVLILLPQNIRTRFISFSGSYDYASSLRDPGALLRMEAIASALSRKQLLIDSLVVTMQHPLLGVGPGNFMMGQGVLAEARHERPNWQTTHNTYTQVSSEMGVPGLIIYLAFLFSVFRVLNSIIRSRYSGRTWQNLRQLALTLRAAVIVFLPVAFVTSLAYNTDVPILAGLTTALGFMAHKQRAIDRAASAQTVPAEPFLDSNLEPVAVGRY